VICQFSMQYFRIILNSVISMVYTGRFFTVDLLHNPNTPWNPKVPSLAEAMDQALTSEEAEKFVNHLRPLVESGQGVSRSAVAYLWAVK